MHADALPSECHASALCRSPSSSSGWVFANPRSREIESTTNKTLPEHENNDEKALLLRCVRWHTIQAHAEKGPSKLNPQAILPIFENLSSAVSDFLQCKRNVALNSAKETSLNSCFMAGGWFLQALDHTRSSTPRPRQGGDLTLSALTTTGCKQVSTQSQDALQTSPLQGFLLQVSHLLPCHLHGQHSLKQLASKAAADLVASAFPYCLLAIFGVITDETNLLRLISRLGANDDTFSNTACLRISTLVVRYT